MAKEKNKLRKISQFTGKPLDTVLIIGSIAIGTIAAFAWRDLSDELFEKYFPKNGNAVRQRLSYAIVVTIIAIIVIYIFAKITNYNFRGTTTTTVIQTTTSNSPNSPTSSTSYSNGDLSISNDF